MGAQWYSLSLFGKELEQLGTNDQEPCDRLASYIIYRAGQRYPKNRNNSAPDTDLESMGTSLFHVEIGFQHLHSLEQYLVAGDLLRADYHASQYVLALELSVLAIGEFWPEEDHGFIRITAAKLISRLTEQLRLSKSIRRGQFPSRLTFVLGMHRSGTSALTGLLVNEEDFNAPDDLMPATEANARGYWESQGLCIINERLLARLGIQWTTVNPPPIGWEDSEAASIWREETLQHIQTVFPDAEHPVIKDPRYCLLLPGLSPWLESGWLDVSFLVTVRHPFETARSLEVRDGISVDQGIKIWLRHVFDAEKHSRGFARKIIRFDDLIASPDDILEVCRKLLKIHSEEGEKLVSSSSFVESELKHQKLSDIFISIQSITNRIAAERAIACQVNDLLVAPGSATQKTFDVLSRLWLAAIDYESTERAMGSDPG